MNDKRPSFLNLFNPHTGNCQVNMSRDDCPTSLTSIRPNVLFNFIVTEHPKNSTVDCQCKTFKAALFISLLVIKSQTLNKILWIPPLI